MKVHMVSRGEYSDYQVVGIFSTKEKAEAYIEFSNSFSEGTYDSPFLDAELVVDELDELGVLVQQGKRPFTVYMQRSGDSTVTDAMHDYFRPEDHNNNGVYRRRGDPSRLILDVWAKDEAGAAKIANERRLALIMNGEWPEDVGGGEPQQEYGDIPF